MRISQEALFKVKINF